MSWYGHCADPAAPYDTSYRPDRCHHCETEHSLMQDEHTGNPPHYPVEYICEDCADRRSRACPVCGLWPDDDEDRPACDCEVEQADTVPPGRVI